MSPKNSDEQSKGRVRGNKPLKSYRGFEIVKNYKTEMCRNWEDGRCAYGIKCIFAHGFEDLKTKTRTPVNYKTKKCKQFFDLGYCSYGQRCQFLHLVEKKEQEKRLPVFINLSNSSSVIKILN